MTTKPQTKSNLPARVSSPGGAGPGLLPYQTELNAAQKAVIVIGRGGNGKTTVCRLLAERAAIGNRPLKLIDLEPLPRGLKTIYRTAAYPRHSVSSGAALAEWLMPLIEEAATTGDHLLIDTGGDDMRLAQLGMELGLADVFGHYEIAPVVIPVTGIDPDDILILRQLADRGNFVARNILIIINEKAFLAHRDRTAAEQIFAAQPFVFKLIAEGGIAVLPSRDIVQMLDKDPISYHDACKLAVPDGLINPLSAWRRSILSKWVEQADATLDPYAWMLP